jgi:hypothetical protein
MSDERLGISHSLPEGVTVVHSTILGANCLGRITDLLSAWCSRELSMGTASLSDFRLLTQALMEFSCPKAGESLGQIELAESEGLLIVATRFPCRLALNSQILSKELTQYWLNSEEVKLLKRMLSPHDRVEVRYHEKLNLIEWRVCRHTGLSEVVMDHSESFRVMTDLSSDLDSANVQYQELGDLPFTDWLTDAYKNRQTGNRAGSVTVAGGESQDEQEWARIVVEREKEDIEKNLETIFHSDLLSEEELIRQFSAELGEQSSEIHRARNALSEEEIEGILTENRNLKDAAKEVAMRVRKLELTAEREKVVFQQKTLQLESLLHKKEYQNQRHQSEMKVLHQKIAEQKKTTTSSTHSDHFRVKALEMYEMLKKIKEDNKILERSIVEMKRKERDASDGPSSSGMNQKHLEELTKKMERNQRALDSEKLKVKTLSERVIIAEKEAQSAGPLIDDLESKVEHTLKVVQQHKKETEQVKLKLVQSDAEKNRIKNDLMKAQAQIQTMMKRQAS